MTTEKLCLLAALALAATSASAAFRCVDEQGRTHIADTPPPACANVVMYETKKGGAILRTIEPAMSEEQRKAKQEAEQKAKLAARAAAEQKRKDTALLSTYANEKEVDTARDRNIEPLKARINLSQERTKEIDKRMKVVKEEMEFYTDGKKKGGKEDMSATMAKELERLADEKKTIQKNIAGYEKEIGELSVKYDVDKRRWLELKQGSSATAKADVAASDAKVEPVKADAKAGAKAKK